MRYSYCSAASTFNRAARRAGKIAAKSPTMIAANTNTTSVPQGIAKTKKPIAWLISSARPTPERDAKGGADRAVTTLS